MTGDESWQRGGPGCCPCPKASSLLRSSLRKVPSSVLYRRTSAADDSVNSERELLTNKRRTFAKSCYVKLGLSVKAWAGWGSAGSRGKEKLEVTFPELEKGRGRSVETYQKEIS